MEVLKLVCVLEETYFYFQKKKKKSDAIVVKNDCMNFPEP